MEKRHYLGSDSVYRRLFFYLYADLCTLFLEPRQDNYRAVLATEQKWNSPSHSQDFDCFSNVISLYHAPNCWHHVIFLPAKVADLGKISRQAGALCGLDE